VFYHVTVVHHNDIRAQYSPVIEQILGPSTTEYLVECDDEDTLREHLAEGFQRRFGVPLISGESLYPYVTKVKRIEKL
jgi:hypothetical protein